MGLFRRARLPGVAGVLGALLIAGVAAGAAGQALILGQGNDSGTSQTTLTNAGLGAAFTLKTTNVSTNATGIFGWSSQTGTNVTNGVFGRADGPNAYGVNARHSGAAGNGAAILAAGNLNNAIKANTTEATTIEAAANCSTTLCGVNGVNATGGGMFGTGVFGTGSGSGSGVVGTGAVGVYGEGPIGVLGIADSATSWGVYGFNSGGNGLLVESGGVTNAIDDFCDGTGFWYCGGGRFAGTDALVGQTNGFLGAGLGGEDRTCDLTVSPPTDCTGYSAFLRGNAHVDGTLTVTGAKTGYVADYAINGSAVTLRQGDAVTLIGVKAAEVGSIPMLLVGPAKSGDIVIGVVDREMVPAPATTRVTTPARTIKDGFGHDVKIPARTATVSANRGQFLDGGTDVKPGAHLLVVTLGAYAYGSVDAAGGAIKAGDSLAASDKAGKLVKARPLTVEGQSFTAPGTSVGYALGALNDGTGRIAIFVSPH